jgi:tRNA nucleotidyltransferase (CCA-adding enzyme)
MAVMQVNISKEVKLIIDKLNAEGFEAYIVGGCVRDCIVGRQPEDWDITTNARPDEIKALFNKTIDTGIKHGTVTIVVNGGSYEVTTYRIDGEYADNRHPNSVKFTSSLREDLSRRDFTINAIAYHPSEGFIDPFGGMQDIERKMIRAVGDASARFREDALRMLRAVRFSAQLAFSIDDKAIQAIQESSRLIKNVSIERIRNELTKILVSPCPMRFIMLRDTHILQHILPEFEVCFHTVQNHPYHIYNVAIHTLNAVSCIEPDMILRWAMLLHDIGKPLTKTVDEQNIGHFYGHPEKSVKLAEIILKRLRFDNKSTGRILRLVKHHDRRIESTYKSVRKAAAAVGEDIFLDLLKIQAADKKAQNPEYLYERLAKLKEVKEIFYQIRDRHECLGIKNLAVNGNDLINIGFAEGKQISIVLNKLLKRVLENPELNDKEKLLEISRELL